MVTSQSSIERFGRSNLIGARAGAAAVWASASRVAAISPANTAKAETASRRVIVMREPHRKRLAYLNRGRTKWMERQFDSRSCEREATAEMPVKRNARRT